MIPLEPSPSFNMPRTRLGSNLTSPCALIRMPHWAALSEAILKQMEDKHVCPRQKGSKGDGRSVICGFDRDLNSRPTGSWIRLLTRQRHSCAGESADVF